MFPYEAECQRLTQTQNACRALDGAVRSAAAFLKTQTLEITSFGNSLAARLISDDADIVAAAVSATELASNLDTTSFVSITSTQRSIEVENGLFIPGLEVGHDCLLRALIFPDEVPNSLGDVLESARDEWPELVLSRGFVPNLAGVVVLGGIRRSLLETLCCLPAAKVSHQFAAFQLAVRLRPLANGAILQCEGLRSATVVLRSISGANSGLAERVQRAIRRLQSARTDAVVVLGAGAAELSCRYDIGLHHISFLSNKPLQPFLARILVAVLQRRSRSSARACSLPPRLG